MSISLETFENWADKAFNDVGNGAKLAARIQDSQNEGQMRVGPVPPKALIVANRLISGTQEYKTANWNARKAILDMIRDQLNITADTPIDQFPSGVKDAMKMGFFKRLFFSGDWEQANGRPLTARRIRAIVNAVRAEQAARTEKPVTDLLAVSSGVKGVVNGDEDLKKALRNNPEGAAQLCAVLRTDRGTRDLFVQNETFRNRVCENLRKGCKHPLPTGTFSVPLERQSLDSLKEGFNKVLDETRASNFNDMLKQCAKDLYRRGIVISWKNGDSATEVMGSTESDYKAHLILLMANLNVVDDENRAKFLAILNQGMVGETFSNTGFCSGLSLPKGAMGGGVSQDYPLRVNFSKTDEGNLKCEMDVTMKMKSLGVADGGESDGGGMMCYDDKPGATMKVGVKFDLGDPGHLHATNVDAKDEMVQFSNLRHNVDAYDDIP